MFHCTPTIVSVILSKYLGYLKIRKLGKVNQLSFEPWVTQKILLFRGSRGTCEDLADGEPGLEALFDLATKYEVPNEIWCARSGWTTQSTTWCWPIVSPPAIWWRPPSSWSAPTRRPFGERPEWKQLVHAQPELIWSANWLTEWPSALCNWWNCELCFWIRPYSLLLQAKPKIEGD